jgi:class 3 adenylate cyclase
LSVRFDPEELREEIHAYQNAVSAVVTRYDGFVAKYMGDGVLAYFGYPRAHEDDAERAVRAGLEIEAAVTSLETRGTEPLAGVQGCPDRSEVAEQSRCCAHRDTGQMDCQRV